jgi:hypothetical protein
MTYAQKSIIEYTVLYIRKPHPKNDSMFWSIMNYLRYLWLLKNLFNSSVAKFKPVSHKTFSLKRDTRTSTQYTPVFKGIVSRDFVVCFLVSFDRYDISTNQEWVLLLLKVRFCIEFFNFRVWTW